MAYFGAFTAMGLLSASIGPTLPWFAESTGSNLSDISFLLPARSVGFLVASSQLSKLYDRYPGHPIIASVLLVIVVLISLIPFLPSVWLLTLVIFLMGTSQGLLAVGSNTLILWVNHSKTGAYTTGLHIFFGIGASISPVLVAWAFGITGEALYVYWLFALLFIPLSIYTFRQPSPTYKSSKKNVSDDEKGNKLILILLLFLVFFYLGAEANTSSWLYSYTIVMFKGTETTAAYLNSAFWICLTIGRFIAIPLALKIAPRFIIGYGLFVSFISASLIFLFPSSIIILWIGTIGLGLFLAPIFPVGFALAERRMHMTAKITGYIFTAASLGAIIMPFVVGQLFEPVGAHITFVFIIGSIVLCLLSLYLFLHFCKKQSTT